ncbi:MAG: bifunctional riboflavin kinase/FAD synthetase [Ignavibacteria bacterium]
MLVVNGFDKNFYNKKSVISVGTFDGVHLGHRKILDEVLKIKSKEPLRAVIITFDPHPQTVLKSKGSDLKILTTTEEKLSILERLGIDVVYVVEFNNQLAQTSAEDFLGEYLFKIIGVEHLVIGYDHTFGKNREGNYETLKKISNRYGFQTTKVDEFRLDGERVSSSVIRKLLQTNNITKANRMLGYLYSLRGIVVAGDKRGLTIGFPTANLEINSPDKLIPAKGVYLVSVQFSGRQFYGMMNVGNRPTIGNVGKVYLEVHLFDFTGNLYGQELTVQFLDFLRNEIKFDSIQALTKQLTYDKEISIQRIKQITKH